MEKLTLWQKLGNIEEGRKTLGQNMPVLVYRLFQYAIKDVLAEEYGAEKTSDIFRKAGYMAGIEFAENTLHLEGDFDYFIVNLTEILESLKIGFLRVEKSDSGKTHLVLTVSEDLDCSGLPVTGDTVCDYDEGFISGILEKYTGQPFDVREIDCWANGDRTCRFDAKLSKKV
jgi:hypothetical protein